MKTNVSKIIKDTKMTVSKHSPEILTGLGIAGMAATTVLAVKATPKAILLLKEAENEKETHDVRRRGACIRGCRSRYHIRRVRRAYADR